MSSEEDRLMAPWGNIAPGFWDSGEQNGTHARIASAPAAVPSEIPPVPPEAQAPVDPAAGPPPEYAARVATIFRTIENKDAADLAAVQSEAEALDQEITAAYGEAHPHTVSIREVRGWLALENQQPETAVRWYLHTTGLQARLWGSAHKHTSLSARQAAYAWSLITDPEQSHALGTAVLEMLRQTVGEGDKLTAHVRHHLPPAPSAGPAARP
jgi:hypothetical protein